MPSTHHELVVRLEGDEAKPSKKELMLKLGDTVHYSSPDGELTILFRDDVFQPKPKDLSPFVALDGTAMLIIKGDTTVTVARTGKFACGCNIKLKTGKVIGWNPDRPKEHALSGGIHHVPD